MTHRSAALIAFAVALPVAAFGRAAADEQDDVAGSPHAATFRAAGEGRFVEGRAGERPDHVVVMTTGVSLRELVRHLMAPGRGPCPHFAIGEDGFVVQLVDVADTAAVGEGERDRRAIGIALCGVRSGADAPAAQETAASELLTGLASDHAILLDERNVVAGAGTAPRASATAPTSTPSRSAPARSTPARSPDRSRSTAANGASERPDLLDRLVRAAARGFARGLAGRGASSPGGAPGGPGALPGRNGGPAAVGAPGRAGGLAPVGGRGLASTDPGGAAVPDLDAAGIPVGPETLGAAAASWQEAYGGIEHETIGAKIPRSGLANATLRRALGVAVEPHGSVRIAGGAPFVAGTISHFGGPSDRGVSATETGALTGEILRHLNPKTSPSAAEINARRQLYYFAAMRFDYSTGGRAFWKGAKLLVVNPRTGSAVVVRNVDWGPNTRTRRIVDVSPQTMKDLGVTTDDVVYVSFANPRSRLGPVGR